MPKPSVPVFLALLTTGIVLLVAGLLLAVVLGLGAVGVAVGIGLEVIAVLLLGAAVGGLAAAARARP